MDYIYIAIYIRKVERLSCGGGALAVCSCSAVVSFLIEQCPSIGRFSPKHRDTNWAGDRIEPWLLLNREPLRSNAKAD